MTETKFTTEELDNEIWKPIPGFEGYYSASSLGRIRRDKDEANTFAGRIMKSRLERNGYLRIMLTKNGKRSRFLVHQLIALAFIGPNPEKLTVNHKDPKTGKTDNRASNLEYATQQEQMNHAKIHGLVATGDRNAARKHPERVARGDRNGAKLHPERLARGDRHGSRTHPERVPRGDRHMSRTKPEALRRGETATKAKLTEQQVSEIRKRYTDGGVSQTQLAKEYGINQTAIGFIIRRVNWKHVP